LAASAGAASTSMATAVIVAKFIIFPLRARRRPQG
jgi:hypothetical protein